MKIKNLLLVLIPLLLIYSCKDNPADKSEVKILCPEKIASLSLASDEILFDLVDTDKIVGVTYLAENRKLSNVHGLTSGIPNKLYPNLEQIIEMDLYLLSIHLS